MAGRRRQEAARRPVGMDLRRLPSGKSGTLGRRRRPCRRANSRSRSNRHRQSRPRSRPVGAVVGVSGSRLRSAWLVTTAHILEEMRNRYEGALAGRFNGQTEKNHRPKLIRAILDQAVHRKWRQLAKERIEDVKPKIPLGKRFWALTKERKALKD